MKTLQKLNQHWHELGINTKNLKPIPNTDDRYLISTCGRVFSISFFNEGNIVFRKKP